MPEAPEVKWVFMVVVIGALYMSKTKSEERIPSKVKFPFGPMTPAGVKPDGDYSNSPYKLGSDGKWANEASIYAPGPKKGGIFNTLNSVAPSVPRQRQMIILRTREEMSAVIESWDEATKAEFCSMKNEAEVKAWLNRKGYAQA